MGMLTPELLINIIHFPKTRISVSAPHCTHTFTHPQIHKRTHTHALSLSLSLSHTHTHTHRHLFLHMHKTLLSCLLDSYIFKMGQDKMKIEKLPIA